MKSVSLLCAVVVLLGCLQLPLGYFTFLRIVVTIGAVTIFVREVKNVLNLYATLFLGIAILFNPIFPIYLYQKAVLIPLDICAGFMFLVSTFKEKSINK